MFFGVKVTEFYDIADVFAKKSIASKNYLVQSIV